MQTWRIGSTLILSLFLFWGASHGAFAAYGDVVATFPYKVSKFARDDGRNRIYASLPDQNSIAVIDTTNLSLINTVWVGSNPAGLTLSDDRKKLYVANRGSTTLGVVDLDTLTLLQPVYLPTTPFDVKMGQGGILYVTPHSQSTGIMKVDAATGNYLGDFSLGVSIYVDGMLEVSPDKTHLYFGNVGLSPGTLAKFDVSTTQPVLIWMNPHGSLGSNGQDLALTADGNFISYAVGGGNQGYVIHKMSATNFAVLGSFNTGAYPREITYSPNGLIAYTIHTSGLIDVFDAQTFVSNTPITTAGEATELLTDKSGGRLFAAFDQELRVYDVGGGAVPSSPIVSVQGVNVDKVTCTNLDTHQTVKITPIPGETSWDCAAYGLVVQPGDRIRIVIPGTIPNTN